MFYKLKSIVVFLRCISKIEYAFTSYLSRIVSPSVLNITGGFVIIPPNCLWNITSTSIVYFKPCDVMDSYLRITFRIFRFNSRKFSTFSTTTFWHGCSSILDLLNTRPPVRQSNVYVYVWGSFLCALDPPKRSVPCLVPWVDCSWHCLLR